MAAKIYKVSNLLDKKFVFKDRDDAAKALSEMIKPYYKKAKETLVFAITFRWGTNRTLRIVGGFSNGQEAHL